MCHFKPNVFNAFQLIIALGRSAGIWIRAAIELYSAVHLALVILQLINQITWLWSDPWSDPDQIPFSSGCQPVVTGSIRIQSIPFHAIVIQMRPSVACF